MFLIGAWLESEGQEGAWLIWSCWPWKEGCGSGGSEGKSKWTEGAGPQRLTLGLTLGTAYRDGSNSIHRTWPGSGNSCLPKLFGEEGRGVEKTVKDSLTRSDER